jgi:hypothetical protein
MKIPYDIVQDAPVAKFYYKGTGNQPTKRTIFVTAADRKKITGYEVRRGSRMLPLASADNLVIKTFLRKDIAKPGPGISAGNNKHTSLKRMSFKQAAIEGL